MKKPLISLILLSFTIFLISFIPSNSQDTNDLVVHEWGTFTTLIGSNGKQLSGLYIEEEKLPSFVYKHSFPESLKDRLRSKKGNFIEPLNVTVKMETPVLYFYSKKAHEVSVKVDFPNGSICQWYPQRTSGDQEKPENIKNVNFGNSYNGWISWNNFKILPPNSSLTTTTDKEIETKTWVTPRETDANLIEMNGEVEKFLFYRGLGNFSIPLEIKFISKNDLLIKNIYKDEIPFVFVYEKKENGDKNIWWTGKIKSGKTIELKIKKDIDGNVKKEFKKFTDKLIEQGLYDKEAKAMLKTWETSYFERPGFRVFWIVPDKIVDHILPLKIEPTPKEIKRVFVGRCDLLTPEFEEKLVKTYQNNSLREYKNDRYYLSMLERVKTLEK